MTEKLLFNLLLFWSIGTKNELPRRKIKINVAILCTQWKIHLIYLSVDVRWKKFRFDRLLISIYSLSFALYSLSLFCYLSLSFFHSMPYSVSLFLCTSLSLSFSIFFLLLISVREIERSFFFIQKHGRGLNRVPVRTEREIYRETEM